MMKEWFCNWFDTRYYSQLYKHRNDSDAAFFIDNLLHHLDLKKGSSILDMPCGKGRHSIYLNKKGFDVIGLDLSKESIKEAKQFENDTLKFALHDMRNLYRINYFDVVVNLFTSLGYFKFDREEECAVKSMSAGLKKGGRIVIDFINTSKAAAELVKEDNTTLDEVNFKIERSFDNNTFVKKITVDDAGKKHVFQEKVKGLTLDDFKRYFSKSGLVIDSVFGNYKLDAFDINASDRLIIIGHKA